MSLNIMFTQNASMSYTYFGEHGDNVLVLV